MLMRDMNNQLWVQGENTHGCLGTSDNVSRIAPALNPFFDNKRIIDIAAGDKFSVVIAEVFDLSPEEEEEVFGKETHVKTNMSREPVNGITLGADNLKSTKSGIRCTKIHEDEIGDVTKSRLPLSIREEVSSVLHRNAIKRNVIYNSLRRREDNMENMMRKAQNSRVTFED
jgi:hypothetical protein